MTASHSPTLVIGVGNEYRGDDGAGIAVARLLRNQLPSQVRILEQSGEGTSLLDSWRAAASVVLVDAVQSGAAPGTIHRFDASQAPVPAGLFPCSTHAFGVAEAIEMARALHELPSRMVVYGIEGADFADGNGLSPAVQRAVAQVAAQVGRELRNSSDIERRQEAK